MPRSFHRHPGAFLLKRTDSQKNERPGHDMAESPGNVLRYYLLLCRSGRCGGSDRSLYGCRAGFGFPSKSGGAEDCGIGFLELAQKNLGFAFEDSHHVAVHRVAQRTKQEFTALGETAEEHKRLWR